MLFVFHQRRLLRGELLKHSGDGSSADIEMLGESVAGDPFLVPGPPNSSIAFR